MNANAEVYRLLDSKICRVVANTIGRSIGLATAGRVAKMGGLHRYRCCHPI